VETVSEKLAVRLQDNKQINKIRRSVYLGNLKTIGPMERNILEIKDKGFVRMSKIIQTLR
jgi:hypothetical protein